MRVLVTGGSGFLGGWLTRRLVEEGHSVRVLLRNPEDIADLGDASHRMAIESVYGDITNSQSVLDACRGVDSVFHLAGLIAYSKAQRPAMNTVNIGGTQNVVDACIAAGVRRLLHLSSVTAVGASFDKSPLNENSPYNIGHLNLGYFETKHQAEMLVKSAVTSGKLDAVMINPSTIYGPGDAKKGSRSTQLKVARGTFPFYTSGGVSVVAVEDAIDCIIAAWKNGRSGERYIVSGENLLIKELFTLIADAAGVKPPAIYLPNVLVKSIGKVGDALESLGSKGPLNSENAWSSILYHWFDNSKARRELGLNPKPASYAIGQSVKWMKDNGLLE
jgi:dihydroflavonol-4-reductase